MKFPFILRRKAEKALHDETVRRKKAGELSLRAKERSERAQSRAQLLEVKIRELEDEVAGMARTLAQLRHEPDVGVSVARNGASSDYRAIEVNDDDMCLHIDEIFSSGSQLVMKGFILVKHGDPKDVRFTSQGIEPEFVQWIDRADVLLKERLKGFSQHLQCGFLVRFNRRDWHSLTVSLPGGMAKSPRDLYCSTTGIAPGAIEPSGMTLSQFAEKVNRECTSVLEIGSRVVSPGSASKRSLFAPHVKYTGFDIYPDGNTDVVGDAHRLSSYFKENQRFDAVFSVSVFEHLAMPWLAALEVNKILKVGGLAFHSTPFTWPLHETPWDFWRYSHEGLRMLFSPAIGFEAIELGVSGPCRICFEGLEPDQVGMPFHRAYAEGNILVRKVSDFSGADFRWNVSMGEVLPEGSAYPTHQG